jgi:ABC-type phosphate transport system permease subunit
VRNSEELSNLRGFGAAAVLLALVLVLFVLMRRLAHQQEGR